MHAKRLETKRFHSKLTLTCKTPLLHLCCCCDIAFLLLLCKYGELCHTSAFVADTVKLEKALGLSKQIKDEEAK